MRNNFAAVLIAVLATQVHSAPQLISFTDGKLGVNFGGYHAAVGLGGLLGNGANGGLFAEAGTPHGQSAKAGLGGSVNANGGPMGALYAGATAGENVQAAAGLAGSVNGGTPAGAGYASAQAGNRFSSSSLVGDDKNETERRREERLRRKQLKQQRREQEKKLGGVVAPLPQKSRPNDKNKPLTMNTNYNVPFEIKTEGTNELKPGFENSIDLNVKKSSQITKDEVNFKLKSTNIENQKPHGILEATNVAEYKPNIKEFHKTSFVGGAVGASIDSGYISPQKIQKRIDIGSDVNKNDGISAQTNTKTVDQISYKKEVTIGRNPTFFEDIFNIPIAALSAVKTFLTNTAGNTSISVQKSGSITSDSESISPKHAPSSSVKVADTQISVATPNASQLLDDILAIPINTLGAVNKFLDNNVPLRKRVLLENGQEQFSRNVGPHARRRALRKEIFEQNNQKLNSESERTI